MRRRNAALLGTVIIVGGLAAAWPWWGPPAGRRIAWFAADRVEVAGARLLPPAEVLQASGVRVGTNVWADPAPFVLALRRHPAVASAEVVRVWPRSLRIRIVEKTPAALVQSGVLRPATADGEVLQVDAARAGVDLPLFTARVRVDGHHRITDADARATLAETARLSELEPALMARVSEVRPLSRTETRLVLSRPAADVLVRDGIGPAALVRLRAALDDVAARAAADTTPQTARTVVDARFDDQIVVRGKS
jgi:cell division protein FtsQ